jgi:hypothetical protein
MDLYSRYAFKHRVFGKSLTQRKGFDPDTISVPCKLEAVHKTIDVCQAVRDGLGSIGETAMKNAEAMCVCAPEAYELLKDGLANAVASGADISVGVLKLVGAFVNAQKVRQYFQNGIYRLTNS